MLEHVLFDGSYFKVTISLGSSYMFLDFSTFSVWRTFGDRFERALEFPFLKSVYKKSSKKDLVISFRNHVEVVSIMQCASHSPI